MESTRTLIDRRSPREVPRPDAGGLLLERYRLIERLGEGGFGVVWRARDEALGREVAIKRVLRDSPAAEGEGREGWRGDDRARREALAAARLSHPAIAALYEARAEGGYLYLISELVRGESLAARIAARSLRDPEILAIGVAIAEALEHAHSCGVIHRDVKPANIIVLDERPDHAGRVPAKLTDFGSALLTGRDAVGREHERDPLTRAGDVIGTLAYMAPEQSEGLRATEQSDLYALALVLYEALGGVNPLRRGTIAQTARHLGEPLPPLGGHRPDLPRALTAALDRALLVEPRARGALPGLRHTLEAVLPSSRRARPTVPLVPRGPAPAGLRGQGRPPRPAWEEAPAHAPAAAAPAQVSAAALPPHAADAAETASAGAARGVRLPRLLWWGLALAAIVWQTLAGRAGAAVVLAAMALPLLALPRRAAPGWLIAALAPLLGAAGLAGAFPALAGQWRRWQARASIAALAYWWLLLAQPLVRRSLWLWPASAGGPLAAGWTSSPTRAVVHVLWPLASTSTAEGIAAWGLAALLLPLVVRGRGIAWDLVGASAWAAALAASGPFIAAAQGGAGAAAGAPRGAVAGAILGGIGAIAARALRGPVAAGHRS